MDFLHRVDSLKAGLVVVKTDAAALRQASFLDGRERFWTEERIEPFDWLSMPSGTKQARAPGWIFHMGFCGSTLLSRMLDTPDEILCLREPHALVDLSDQLAAPSNAGHDMRQWVTALADHYAGLPEQRQLVVKPSNWANPLLPAMHEAKLLRNVIFVTMELRPWLLACLRGGRDRLSFVARCVQNSVRISPEYTPMLQEAVLGAKDPIDQVIRLAAVLYAIQARQFDAVDPDHKRRVDFGEIVEDPKSAVYRAQALLALPSGKEESLLSPFHSKDPSRTFSLSQRDDEDRLVLAEHGARLEAAANWIETAVAL